MPPTGLPTNLHAIKGRLGIKGLAQTQTSMRLIHKWKITLFLNILKIAISDLPNIVSPNTKCIVLGDSGEEFVLLGLILEDRDLLGGLGTELLAEEGVAHRGYERDRVGFRGKAGNVLTDWHHGCVTHLWVPFFLYLAAFAHGYVTT
jgi:hypothetical protein